MPLTEDEIFMRHALACARLGEGHTRPNPPVGAVLVRAGKVIAKGYHARCGGDHAEVAAIKAAPPALLDRQTTLYVTLEPCSRAGRVGPCTDAIRAAGIGRVVYAAEDPNPTNRQRATRALAAAGIRCEQLVAGRVADAAARLIAPFACTMRDKRPFVTVKLAMSLDGRICDNAGSAQWISSASSRRRTGLLRTRVDAIMVGAETVRRDDPSLLSHGRPNPDLMRIIVTRSGRLPRKARVFTDEARARTFICVVGAKNKMSTLEKWAQAAGLGGVWAVPTLKDALCTLYREIGALHLLCEGGLKLATSLAEAGLVDEWLTVLAPKVIGSRPIAEACEWSGNDTFVTYRR